MIDVEKTAQTVVKSWRAEYRNTFRLFSDILQKALVSARRRRRRWPSVASETPVG